MTVFWLVVLGRFVIPLFIPRYPLPGLLAALLLDAVDQTIFQVFTPLDLSGYQGYDKALDIYYLAIAYISTFRNWRNLFAFKVSRFLWYYRLVGVTLFEVLEWRPMLLFFPNTFEYFFILYHLFVLRWHPRQLTRRSAVLAAVFVSVFIKVPQEYWIHVARMDVTDFLKVELFGASLETPWTEVVAANVWLIPAGALLLLGMVLLLRWWVRRLPPATHPAAWTVPMLRITTVAGPPAPFFSWMLLEKIMLVAPVCIIFAQVMPGMRANSVQIAVGTVFIIVLNTLASHWLTRRGVAALARPAPGAFLLMAVVNFILALIYIDLLLQQQGAINTSNLLFFVLLLTLIVILYDSYYPIFRRWRRQFVAR